MSVSQLSPGAPCLIHSPMIRSDLVLRLAAQNPHLYEKDCQAVVDTILGRIADALVAGRSGGDARVRLVLGERAAGAGWAQPKDRSAVLVSAKDALVFKAGKEMRDRVNP